MRSTDVARGRVEFPALRCQRGKSQTNLPPNRPAALLCGEACHVSSRYRTSPNLLSSGNSEYQGSRIPSSPTGSTRAKR